MTRALLATLSFLATSAAAPLWAETVAPAEKAFVDLINQERAALGRPKVALSPELCGAARAHSHEMATEGYLSHRSPETGTPSDRVRKADVPAVRVLEHIARGASTAEAHQQLMKDKKYLANIVDRGLDLAGIGIAAAGKDAYLFTILLVEPIATVDTAKATKALLRSINAKRRTQDAPELKAHTGLAKLAQETCRIMNKKGGLFVGDTIRNGIGEVGLSYRKYRSAYRLTKDLDTVLALDLLHEPRFRRIGLAILPNDHPRKTLGSLWVTIILVEP